jgi:hypothetical protein
MQLEITDAADEEAMIMMILEVVRRAISSKAVKE